MAAEDYCDDFDPETATTYAHEARVAELSGALNSTLKATPVPKPARPSPACDLLLIDVAHLFWAAWHASEDQEVGAAFSSTIDRLNGVLADAPHERAAVCIDWPPYWRVEACSEYKAQRARPSEFAVAQFRRVREQIAADGHVVWGKKGFEADDVIATACRIAGERGLRVTIASGDKDLMQLVNDATIVYDTRSGETYGAAEVITKYGVPPGKVRDLLTLTGDTSDNVPGVKGVGPKKASGLIETFGGWRAAVQGAREFSNAIPAGLAKLLREHDDYELAWTLVGLRDDAPIQFDALFPSDAPAPTVLEEKVSETSKQQRKAEPMGKMSVLGVTSGRIDTPCNILMYGQEGVGKSTFASKAPSPVFFDLEGGTEELDVQRMPTVESWQDFVDGVDSLLKEKHQFKTVVVDPADALERLIHRYVCDKAGHETIEDFGYGKGPIAALELWAKYVDLLSALRAKGMHTITLAHVEIKAFANPRGEDYDRFQIQLDKKASAFLRNKSKAVLFVAYDEAIKKAKEAKSTRNKALGDGNRVVYTETRPAFDAKNRYGLPFQLPLDWDEFEAAVKKGIPASLEDVTAELDEIENHLDQAAKAKLAALRSKAAGDPKKLSQLVDFARSMKSDKEAA